MAGSGFTVVRADSDVAAMHPRLRQLLDYWRAIAPAGRLPGRQHLDPLDIPALLPWLWLLEVHHAPLRFRFRLAGTQIAAVHGEDPTGRWFDEFYAGRPIGPVVERMCAAIDQKAPIWRMGPSWAMPEAKWRAIEALTVPLAADGVSVDMLLMCAVVHPA
jgi:hypothetical protein